MNALKEFWAKRSTKQKTTISVIVVILLTSAVGNLFPSKGDSTASPSQEPSSSTSQTFESAGCLRVSEELVDSISQGFDGAKLTGNAAGFLASEYADVKFVAVEFIPNGDTATQKAVFATNDDDLSNASLNGLIVAVDGFAKEFSDWGSAPKLNMSIADKGAKESLECLSLPGAGLADQEAGIEGFNEEEFIATAKKKYGIVEETYDDGSTLTVMQLARTICEAGVLSEMKKNLGSKWNSSFNKFAIETLCPEKLQ